MSCEPWIEALSAAADGEPSGVDSKLLAAHLARCPSCRMFADELEGLGTAATSAGAPMPDLSKSVTRVNAAADRVGASPVLRAGLVLVAGLIAVRSTPALVVAEDSMGMVSHTARHFGAFSVAFAVGLLVVAVRPARARTMLPVAAVVAAALAFTALFDGIDGRVTLAAELRHLPEMASVMLIWLLARARPSSDPAVTNTEGLRLVEQGDDRQREAG